MDWVEPVWAWAEPVQRFEVVLVRVQGQVFHHYLCQRRGNYHMSRDSLPSQRYQTAHVYIDPHILLPVPFCT